MTEVTEIWRYQGGGFISSDFVYGVAAAADNTVFLVGSQDNSNTLGIDLAVVKLDADGDQLWDWQEGSEGVDAFFSAAAVADGVVGSGFVNGTWDETSVGGTNFAVVKLYSNGTVAWRWQEGSLGDDFLFVATETLDGNVVVAGAAQGSWNEVNDGWNDVAVAKLNVDNGEVIWRYQAGTSEESGAYIRAAATRGDGSIVLGGYTFGTFAETFSGDDGATDFLAIALDEDGGELWRWQDGPGTGLSVVLGIAAFSDDSVLLVGVTEGIWGDENLGGRDFAVTKLNGSGYIEWVWQGGTESEEEFAGAATGMGNFVVMSGYTNGSWAATKEGTDDDRDFAAMFMDTDGNILSQYQAGSTSNEDANDVAVRPDGSILLGGWTDGVWTSSESSDLYIDFAAVLLDFNTPASSSTSSPEDSSFEDSKSSTKSAQENSERLIIGISIGGAAAIAIFIACCFCWWTGAKHPTSSPPPNPSSLSLPAVPTAATLQGSKTAVLNTVGIPSPTVYSAPPPAYSELLPAHSDPPPPYPNLGIGR